VHDVLRALAKGISPRVERSTGSIALRKFWSDRCRARCAAASRREDFPAGTLASCTFFSSGTPQEIQHILLDFMTTGSPLHANVGLGWPRAS
jgi:hypothetical protein